LVHAGVMFGRNYSCYDIISSLPGRLVLMIQSNP